MVDVDLTADALLFDLDGTLVDSTPAVTRAWTRWAVEHGVTAAQFRAVHAHGRTASALVADLLPAAQVPAAVRRIDELELADVDGVVPLPGAGALLTALPADRWTIVTSGNRVLATRRIVAAGLPVPSRFVTADDVRHGKPDPEPYLAGAALLGVPPERCVVVEDAPAGLTAARAAGMATVAVTSTHTADELKADLVVADLSRLAVEGTSTLRLTPR